MNKDFIFMMTQFTKFELINWITSYAINLAIKVAFFLLFFCLHSKKKKKNQQNKIQNYIKKKKWKTKVCI